MKKVLFIIILFFVSFALSQGIVNELQELNSEIFGHSSDINNLIFLHQSGVTNTITLSDETEITFAMQPTTAQKAQYRTLARAACDSIMAKAQRMKDLIPE